MMRRMFTRLITGVLAALSLTMFLPGAVQAKGLDAGYMNFHVVQENGTIKAWGRNGMGELGIGSQSNTDTPTEVSVSGVSFVAVSGGGDFTVGLTADGNVYTWGKNNRGQLGLGNTNYPKTTPQPVTYSFNEAVVEVSAGYNFAVARTVSGKVYTWGDNVYGQLGRSTSPDTYSSTPGLISAFGSTVIADISAAPFGYHALAAGEDGTVYTWGYNGYGQLGNNSTTSSGTPVDITSYFSGTAPTIVKVSGNGWGSFAVDTNGQLWSWGAGTYDAIGDGDRAVHNAPTPQAVGKAAFTNKTVLDVTGGWNHTLVLLADGTVWAFGFSHYGELGPTMLEGSYLDANTASLADGGACTAGDRSACSVPYDTGEVTDVAAEIPLPASCDYFVAIAAGYQTSAAMCDNGEVYAWGDNTYLQLGPNTSVGYSSDPVFVGTFTANLVAGMRIYRAASGVLPENLEPDWVLYNYNNYAASPVIIDSNPGEPVELALKIDTLNSGKDPFALYEQLDDNLFYTDSMQSFSKPLIIMAELKVVGSATHPDHPCRDGARLSFTYNDQSFVVWMGPNETAYSTYEGLNGVFLVSLCEKKTSSNQVFTNYRIEADLAHPEGGHYPVKVYKDGEVVFEGLTFNPIGGSGGLYRVLFGDGSAYAEGEAYWKYITYINADL